MIKITKHNDSVIVYHSNDKWYWELRVCGGPVAEGHAETKELAIQAAQVAVNNRGDKFDMEDSDV